MGNWKVGMVNSSPGLSEELKADLAAGRAATVQVCSLVDPGVVMNLVILPVPYTVLLGEGFLFLFFCFLANKKAVLLKFRTNWAQPIL
jgi:hypothetical protein